jgi:hypothetical protein
MKRIPVDTGALSRCVLVDVVPAERDGRQTTNADGVPQYEAQALVQVVGEKRPEVIPVKFATSTPPELLTLVPVELIDLRATLWQLEGRSGIAYSAAEVRPVVPVNGSGKGKAEPVAVGS